MFYKIGIRHFVMTINRILHKEFSELRLSYSNCNYNYRYFRSLLKPRTKLLALVKANAYGHGAVEMARMLQKLGADYLAVAYPSEGTELRKEGISLPIIVLTAGTDYYDEIIKYGLEPGIPNIYALEKFTQALKKFKERNIIGPYPVHIKLDTGMHRLGFSSKDDEELLKRLPEFKEVKIESVYSHFAASEDPNEDTFTVGQAEAFIQRANAIADVCINLKHQNKPLFHILNSAGIQRFPEYQFDMVRLGVGLYGISAIEEKKLRPIASFRCKIIQTRNIDADDTVGYGRKGLVSSETKKGKLAVIPVGYADGVDRRLGCGNASFLVNGKLVPTVGNICMDMCMLDITGVEANIDDEVVLFGEKPTVSELAEKLGTIPYEIMTSIPKRIKRIITK